MMCHLALKTDEFNRVHELVRQIRISPNDEIRLVPPAIEGNIEIESDSAAVTPGARRPEGVRVCLYGFTRVFLSLQASE